MIHASFKARQRHDGHAAGQKLNRTLLTLHPAHAFPPRCPGTVPAKCLYLFRRKLVKPAGRQDSAKVRAVWHLAATYLCFSDPLLHARFLSGPAQYRRVKKLGASFAAAFSVSCRHDRPSAHEPSPRENRPYPPIADVAGRDRWRRQPGRSGFCRPPWDSCCSSSARILQTW